MSFPDFKKVKEGKVTVFGVLLALLVFMAAFPLHGQIGGQGSIQGTVLDPGGAAIVGANVKVTDAATGITYTRKSSSAGDYVVSPLPPGVYSIQVDAQGFQMLLQENIVVDALKSTGVNLVLKVGHTTEQVTVSAAPPQLETTNATLGATMENKTYSQLPLTMGGQQRDPTAFVFLMPGVTGGGRSGIYGGSGSGGYLDEMYVDGIPLTTIDQQGDNRTVSLGISVDAVDQFQVQTSGSPVEYQGAGLQNYVIKSGTNQYHGTVFDYVRNTAFDSWSYFAKAATEKNAAGETVPAPKPSEHQNEFGFTVGGPIKHDKMFFFASYDKFHYTAGPKPGLVTIPTLAERTGDFTAWPNKIYDPTTIAACTAANHGTTCAYQFMGMKNGVPTPNVIPANEISPVAQYMQKFLPDPSNSNLSSNYLSGLPSGAANWEFTGRLDANITPKQRISAISNSGRRGFIGLDYGADTVLPLPYTNGGNVAELTTDAILEHTYTITQNLVNQAKFGYVRQWGPASNATLNQSQYEAASGVGIGNTPPGQSSQTFPAVVWTDIQDTPLQWYSQNGYSQTVNTYTFMDNVLWTHGKHTFTFGGDTQWLGINQTNFDTQSTPLTFNESNVNTAGYNSNGSILNATTGASYASFMIGAIGSTGLHIQPYTTLGARYHTFSPYVEDDYRVTSKLTLNLGLRWDFFPPYHEVQNRWSYLDATTTNPATGNLGALVFAGNGADSCHCQTPVSYYRKNAGPRVGVAYALDEKTVLRGAFGITYAHGGGVGGRLGANAGTGQTGLSANPSFLSSGVGGGVPAFYLNSNLPGGSNNIPTYSSAPSISPITNTGNYINSSGVAVSPNSISYADPYISSRAPYVETWNAGVQRAVTQNVVLTLNYAGSQSHYLSSVGARGYYSDQLDPKYLVLGNLLKQFPNSVDSSTGKTYLQEAQAIVPGIQLPYSNFGSPQGTIGAMLNPFPQYSGVTDTWGDIANASYHSFQLTLAQRPTHGLSYTVNYTYSREIDDQGTYRSGYDLPGNVVVGGRSYKQNQIDRSLGTVNTPHTLHAYGVYEEPFRADNKFANALIRDWSVSGIYSYNAGAPLAIVGSGCNLVGQNTCMPSYAPGYATNTPNAVRKNGGWGHGITAATAGSVSYLNSNAFIAPSTTPYQIGNLSRTAPYNLFGPGGYDIDASVRRTFPVWERVNFVFEADVFNLTNTVTFGGVAVTYPSSNFGTIGNQSNSARDWQFAGRFNF